MLDGQQSDEQYMRELYERFLNGVLSNDNSEFYDQDELLDIYDYAQDEGDEMTQLYVLLAGARLYPDSSFLDERKAFFLSALNDEAARKMLNRKGRKDSALWQVLKLSLETYPDKNPEDGLSQLLASDFRLPCEAIIRLIDMLKDLGRLDLLAQNLNIIAEKSETPNVLFYEAAEAFYSEENFQALARDIAEDLTTREPFNPDNWVLLSKMEFALGHHEESLSAVDYALAIDPDNERALLMKGISLIPDAERSHKADFDSEIKKAVADDLEQGINILQQLLQKNPQNPLAVKALSDGYIRKQNPAAAIEVIASFMGADPANSFALVDIMRLHPKQPERFFQIFHDNVGDTERTWIEFASQLANEGFVVEASQMLEWYNNKSGLSDGMEYYLQLLYRARRFDAYIQTFGKCCEDEKTVANPKYDFSTMAYLMLAASYLMEKEYDAAEKVCNLLLASPPSPDNIDDHLRWKGMQVTLSFIRNLAKSGGNPAISQPDFDPICFQIGVH